MKKGFGWFFAVLGVINIFRAFAMFANQADNAGGIFVFALAFIGLGIWMIISKPKDKNIDKF